MLTHAHRLRRASAFARAVATARAHLPLVFMAMEHARGGNLPQAEQYLRLALQMDPDDFLLSNELGVVLYKSNACVP